MRRILSLRSALCWWALLCAAGAADAQPGGGLSRLPPVEGGGHPAVLPLPALDEDEDGDEDGDEEIGAGDEDADHVEKSVDETIVPPWYSPDVFYDSEFWDSSFEFGINGATGNAETMSFRAGADAKHKTEFNTLRVNFSYARTHANGQEKQNNSILAIRDDWYFRDTPWSMFARHRTEYDEFKAFDVRLSANSGFGYHIVKEQNAMLKGRFGAGVSHEIGGPNNHIVPEAVFGADVESKLTKRQKIESTIDYLPEWADWDDFRIESKFSWAIKLAPEDNVSLKFSLTQRYDSTPEGRKPNDVDYALLLLWKL